MGTVRYRYRFSVPRDVTGVRVTLPRWDGSVTRLRIDQVDRGLIAWPPEQLEIPDRLTAGPHEWEVDVVGNMKNLLGPHFSDGLAGIWRGRWSGQERQPPKKYTFEPTA